MSSVKQKLQEPRTAEQNDRKVLIAKELEEKLSNSTIPEGTSLDSESDSEN